MSRYVTRIMSAMSRTNPTACTSRSVCGEMRLPRRTHSRQDKDDASAIESRNGEDIHDTQVDANKSGKLEQVGDARSGNLADDLGDSYGSRDLKRHRPPYRLSDAVNKQRQDIPVTRGPLGNGFPEREAFSSCAGRAPRPWRPVQAAD